jgi:LacI family transcriptional regulator
MTHPLLRRRRQRKPSVLPKPHHIPHVLLLIDTAGALGRGIVEGIGRYATENGPWSIQYEYRALDSLPPIWLEKWQGDGIITRTVNAKQAKLIQATKLPYVEILGHPKFGIAEVWSDYSVDGQKAVEHFLNRGLRHFAYFTYGKAWWIEQHREAFCKNLKERGYDCHSYRTPTREQNMPVWDERQLPNLIQWLRSLPCPIGVMTPGDLHAVCLLEICRQLHIAVPEEMAILGRGNDAVICETVRPTLSSIDLDARRVGYEAARLLDRKMAGKPVEDLVLIPPTHVDVRQSTDLMVIEDADVVQAMRFIRDYACNGIDVPRVAEEVGLSRRVLERKFFQYLGRTPKAEIMRIRIERAKMLLARTDKPREGIAQQSGFSSPEYFSKVFHRTVGMKPRAYRRMRRVSRDLGTE